MPQFFISYRRKDSQQIIGRIYEKLTYYFGDDAVFLDVEDIAAGIDFRAYLRNMIVGSDVVLAVIGPEWLRSFSLIEPDENDFVLVELEIALEQGVPIIPILLGGTPMPESSALPESISLISFRNAFPLDVRQGFARDLNRLISNLDMLRIGTKDKNQHADHRLVHHSCKALLLALEDAYPADDHVFGAEVQFRLYSTHEFRLPMRTGVSLVLHRVVQDSTSLVELHVILTAWGTVATSQQLIIGWVIEYLKRHPVLSTARLSAGGLEAIPPGVSFRIFPSSENPREIWRDVTHEPYQISASYILRVGY